MILITLRFAFNTGYIIIATDSLKAYETHTHRSGK